jgi:hypothetical protein
VKYPSALIKTQSGLKILKPFEMKKAFAVFCALVLMPGLNAQAWVGGPWSNNNSQPTGDDGIYEAVATMTNGTGMYRWAVRNQSGGATATASDVNVLTAQSGNVLFGGGSLGTWSSNVWYYKGITYYGRAFGTVNSSMGIVSVIGNATAITNDPSDPTVNNVPTSLTGSGNTSNVTITPPTPGTTTTLPGPPPVVISTAGAPGNVLIEAQPQPYPGIANSSFTASINVRSGEVGKRFSGSGTIAFSREPNTTRIIGFIIGASTDVTTDASTPSGEDPTDFSQQGHQRKFKVMGTQVSTQVLP